MAAWLKACGDFKLEVCRLSGVGSRVRGYMVQGVQTSGGWL